MAKRPITIQLEPALIERIDRERGDESRQAWIARAAEQALSEAKEPPARMQADPGSVPSSEGVRSAAPAERPQNRADAFRQATQRKGE